MASWKLAPPFAPTKTVRTSDSKVSANAWSVFIVFAPSCLRIEPKARSVELTGWWRDIAGNIVVEFLLQVVRKRDPILLSRLVIRFPSERWVPHVHAARAATFAVDDRWQRLHDRLPF